MAQARSNPWVVLVVLTLGFFMILLDTTIVNVAIPAMSSSQNDGLNTTLDQILWVLNAYILVYAVLLITAGRLGDLYGQRNLFALGLFVFTLASALCGLSQNATELILARILQGVGGALLTPQTLAIITTLFPPERRGAAFGVWGAVAGLATITGPTLGGAIITYINWRWIFFVNVPIGIGALIATFLIIPDVRQGRRHGWDLVGVLLSTAGLFGIVFGLIEGERYNWGQIESTFFTIPEVIGGGVVLLALFIVWEYFQTEPLIPLSLFADRNFAVANWIAAAISFGMLSLFLPITIYLQSVRGFSALHAGLTLAPMSLTSMVVAPFAGRFADRIGGKYILMAGITVFAIGTALITLVAGPDSDWLNFLVPAIIAGAGMGMTFAPMTTVAMRNIQPRMAGQRRGRRRPPEPAGHRAAQRGRATVRHPARGFPRQVHRPVQLGRIKRVPDRHRPERGSPAAGHPARSGTPGRGAVPRRFRQRIHRRHEADPRGAYRLSVLHRGDHRLDQAPTTAGAAAID